MSVWWAVKTNNYRLLNLSLSIIVSNIKIGGRQNAHRRRKKNVCMCCYFDTSTISTPLPVTSVLATVMLLPVSVLTTDVPAEFQSFHV